MLFENTTYLTYVAGRPEFNLTNTDMVLLKTGSAAGVTNAVHALASNNGGQLRLLHRRHRPQAGVTAVGTGGSSFTTR